MLLSRAVPLHPRFLHSFEASRGRWNLHSPPRSARRSRSHAACRPKRRARASPIARPRVRSPSRVRCDRPLMPARRWARHPTLSKAPPSLLRSHLQSHAACLQPPSSFLPFLFLSFFIPLSLSLPCPFPVPSLRSLAVPRLRRWSGGRMAGTKQEGSTDPLPSSVPSPIQECTKQTNIPPAPPPFSWPEETHPKKIDGSGGTQRNPALSAFDRRQEG